MTRDEIIMNALDHEHNYFIVDGSTLITTGRGVMACYGYAQKNGYFCFNITNGVHKETVEAIKACELEKVQKQVWLKNAKKSLLRLDRVRQQANADYNEKLETINMLKNEIGAL